MTLPPRLPLAVTLLCLGLSGSHAWAAGRVDLEVFLDDRAPLTAAQEWATRLGQVGVTSLQIRAKRSGDQVGMERGGSEASPTYRVVGALNSQNELVLPGARFGLSEAARVAQWLRDLARLGPASERPARVMFGLTAKQLQQARTELAAPIGFSTAGMTRAAAVERIRGRLQLPLEVGRDRREALEAEKVEEDLADLSCGTALAAVLRPVGLCLVPREADAGRLRYDVVRSQPGLEVWPVGWPPEKPERDLVPTMYEFLNANVQGVAITKVLEAVGGRLKMPFLMDHNALARHGIEPEKAIIKLPRSRTTYSILLRKALFQAGLKHEVRVDEAGTAFLWITSIKTL